MVSSGKSFFLFLGLILISAKAGEALFCYGCLASTSSDCFEGAQNSYVVQNCQAQEANLIATPFQVDPKNGPIENVCVEFTQSDFIPKAFTRGCGFIYENVDICEYLQNITHVEGCSYCEEHFCNSKPGTL